MHVQVFKPNQSKTVGFKQHKRNTILQHYANLFYNLTVSYPNRSTKTDMEKRYIGLLKKMLLAHHILFIMLS
jgi:putative transposon-encoded protein